MFDLDGTLIDSSEDLCTAVNLMRKEYGLPALPVKTVAGYVGDGIHKLVERALQGHPADLEQATALCARHYHDHLHDRTVLYAGVHDGLACLHRAGNRLALISNKPSALCHRILQYFRVDALFSCVLGGGDTRHLKPHPEPLLAAMAALQGRPAHSWMIGDHWTDLEAARRAGVRSAWLSYGMGTKGRETPDREFDSFEKLAAFFCG